MKFQKPRSVGGQWKDATATTSKGVQRRLYLILGLKQIELGVSRQDCG